MAIRRSIRWFVPHYLNVIDGWTNEWTDRKSPCSTGLHPLQGRCPKKGKALTELPTPLRRERGLSEVGGETAEKQLGISHKTPKKQKIQDGIPRKMTKGDEGYFKQLYSPSTQVGIVLLTRYFFDFLSFLNF